LYFFLRSFLYIRRIFISSFPPLFPPPLLYFPELIVRFLCRSKSAPLSLCFLQARSSPIKSNYSQDSLNYILNTKFALPYSLVAISLPRTFGPEKQQLIFVTELGVSDLKRICRYTTDFWSVWHDLLVTGVMRYEFLSPAPYGLKCSASNSGHLRPGNSTDAYRIRNGVPRREGCLAKQKGHCSPRKRMSIFRLPTQKKDIALLKTYK
jgi:hypothetical protein